MKLFIGGETLLREKVFVAPGGTTCVGDKAHKFVKKALLTKGGPQIYAKAPQEAFYCTECAGKRV